MGILMAIPAVMSNGMIAISAANWAASMLNKGMNNWGPDHDHSSSQPSGRAMAECQSSLKIPDNDRCLYKTDTGQKYVVVRGLDIYGEAWNVREVNLADECLDICSDTSGCISSRFDGTDWHMTGDMKPTSKYVNRISKHLRTLTFSQRYLRGSLQVDLREFPEVGPCSDDTNDHCMDKLDDNNAGCLTPDNFNVRCSRSFLGHIIVSGQKSTRSLVECLDKRKKRYDCLAVSYKLKRSSSSDLNCWLKDELYLSRRGQEWQAALSEVSS
ncbi:hypothetical protein K458DRAFT_409109 [Lentithecium fluviatile CBS 122367]|uniref:Apple domain-containing protein n=1 Tax=Lentithecium fluviatile CBS 122367 TaxID=1168545 RepID=A0A6G1IIQ7_9PLEO|nr:hypothetical protein K458DRAFT_409109 [Lentithecium fluviatile CBS 122367]